MSANTPLENWNVPVKLKLAALWTSATLCFVYGDIVGMYAPGAVQGMLDGTMGFLGPAPQSQGVLLVFAVVQSIPSVMVFLTVALAPPISRWLNVIVGAAYALIAFLWILNAGAYFFIFLSAVQALLLAFAVWTALKWPRQAAQALA